jgi:hypothetical protein
MTKLSNKVIVDTRSLFQELSQLIDQNKHHMISVINNSLTILFWHIGGKINKHILRHKRADYGKQIVVTLSRQLVEKYGNSFEEKNLRRMMQFEEQFTDIEIVGSLSRHLSWSHFLVLLPIKSMRQKCFTRK